MFANSHFSAACRSKKVRWAQLPTGIEQLHRLAIQAPREVEKSGWESERRRPWIWSEIAQQINFYSANNTWCNTFAIMFCLRETFTYYCRTIPPGAPCRRLAFLRIIVLLRCVYRQRSPCERDQNDWAKGGQGSTRRVSDDFGAIRIHSSPRAETRTLRAPE